MSPDRLGPPQMERYQAHLALPDFGAAAQQRLLRSRVAIVGVGGLGSPATLYLAAAGVGALTLIDDDVVDRTNLQRQVLFGEADIGRFKAQVGVERVAAMNADVQACAVQRRVTAANARELLAGHDAVVDGSDNFATRYVVNDACVLETVPLVSGSIYRYEGQVMVVRPRATACYRCLFPAPPPEQAPCHDAGVLGPLAGIVGAMMAAETLKLIGTGRTALAGRLLLIDALEADVRRVATARDPCCPVCGAAPTIHEPTAVATCELPGG